MPDLNPVSLVAGALQHLASSHPAAPAPHRIAVASRSLRPTSALELVALAHRAGVRWVQLELDPILENRTDWNEIQVVQALRRGGIGIVSGSLNIGGDPRRSMERVTAAGCMCRRLGVSLVTVEASAASTSAEEISGLRQIIDALDSCGVRTGLETGNESAEVMADTLRALERPHTGACFDAAELLMRGMGNPVTGLERLASRVVQMHIRDGMPGSASAPGDEVAAGAGAVDWTRLFQAISHRGIGCDLVIERESGEQRVKDVIAARQMIEEQLRA